MERQEKISKATDRKAKPGRSFQSLNVVASPKYSDEWFTPMWFMDAMGVTFEVDTCSAKETFLAPCRFVLAEGTDGLVEDWNGRRTFTNCPYSLKEEFIAKSESNGDGVVLIPASTGARWFQRAAKAATGFVLIGKRIHFEGAPTGKRSRNGRDSALLIHGDFCHDAIQAAVESGRLPGIFISNRP
jgi:hypothetical protein